MSRAGLLYALMLATYEAMIAIAVADLEGRRTAGETDAATAPSRTAPAREEA